MSWELYCLINTRPNFSKQRRPIVPQWRLNPLARRPARSGAELDAAFDALWDIAEDV